jgi:endogenous inhibitor of DNA gyrase (YacG/DUF329 family)
VNGADRSHARSVLCPRCGKRVEWEGNPQRPFCSLPCRLIDLGRWLDERYRIPVEKPAESGDEDGRAPGAP